MRLRFPVLLFAFLACNTNDSNKVKVQHSFYYWKTTFSKSSNTNAVIKMEGISHFYIHYFDVDWNEKYWMPVPVAEITGFDNAISFTNGSYTPVVVITNSSFLNIDENWCDSLAAKVRNKVNFITNRIEEAAEKNLQQENSKGSIINRQMVVDELQIDCDWTPQTKEKYFRFLESFKKLFPEKKISATIRLYPYKYQDGMGVPPVDKGLLMCYNLSDIKNSKTTNSIFDLKDLQQYLIGKKYPLPLDVALPVFGWYAWFSGGKLKGIIYPAESDVIANNTTRFKKTGENFTALIDTTIGNNYLREGDVLRREFPSTEELEKAAKLLHDKFPVNSGDVDPLFR